MAVTKVKRSVHKKQLAVSNQQSAKTPPKISNRRLTHFPETTGKVVKDIQFSTDPSYNCLELVFNDDTGLSIEIEPSFTVDAYFSRWKAGNQRILRRWPSIRNS